MSVVSCSTTSTTAYKVTADTTGNLVLQTGSGPTTAVTIDTAQNTVLAGTIRMAAYTVATLPAAGTAGRRAYVTNALTPVSLSAVVGGGSVTVPVFDNGTTWIVG
jgi:hypothetical protein